MQLLALRAADSPRGSFSMENRFADTQLFLTHPKASQNENGLTGNLSNRCVRSEQPPNSSTKGASSRAQTRANEYLGGFYQFFG